VLEEEEYANITDGAKDTITLEAENGSRAPGSPGSSASTTFCSKPAGAPGIFTSSAASCPRTQRGTETGSGDTSKSL
jgi:hypothetical protein